jgi:hypothetical protein
MSNPLNFKFGGAKRLVEEVTAQRLNAMLDEIRRSRPLPGAGISLRQESNGVRIDNIARSEGGSPVRITPHPFQILASPKEGGGATLRVRPGTINGVLPTNWSAEQTVGTSLSYIILSVTATNNAINSCSLAVSGTAPAAEPEPVKWGLPTSFAVIIGLVQGIKVWQVVYNNLSFSSSKRITTDRANPQIGQLPYDNFYTWQRVS